MPLKHPLQARFDNLPLILCGPIVRRVEPEIASVWVAIKAPRKVELELYTGYCTPSSPSFPEKQVAFKSVKTPALKIGEHLYLALVTIETTGLLTHGGIFSYNLIFYEGETEKENLISLGLLNEPELIGFTKGQLPSFIVAPEKLENVRIAHGSCRKPHGRGRDGLAALAKIMNEDYVNPDRVQNPLSRPHYLFHTGDQIYADDCSNFLIQHYTDAGNFLLQKMEELPFPKNPDHYFAKQVDKDENFVWFGANEVAFPPNRRATNFYSGFSGDESCHLYSFAEFCAAYLFQWCDVLWPPELPDSKDVFKDRICDHPDTRLYLFPLSKDGDKDVKEPDVPANWDTLSQEDRMLALTPEPTNMILLKAQERYVESHQKTETNKEPKERERVNEFRDALKAVRRVLANVPSIMSFDDHDVTDDWYLNGGWSKRALGTRLGETIIRNGLLAFALFQAWGNDPKGWADKTAHKDARSKLLDEIPKLVAAFKPLNDEGGVLSTTTPPWFKPFSEKFHISLGFTNLVVKPAGMTDDAFKALKEQVVKWHAFLDISTAKVFVLDTRTRRDFSLGLDFPPNLLAKDALEEQIPGNLLTAATELAIVVSGAPVLGIAAIESIGQPIIPRVLDVIHAFKIDEKKEQENIIKRKVVHKGSESLDVEHWSLHIEGFEAMLKRCATLKTVVFLAGDVHYGITSEMDYWPKGEPEAARFVQMVSSSLKNIRPEGQLLGVLPSAITQLALSGGLNREFTNLTSIGWEKPEDIEKLKLRVQTEPGNFSDALPRHYPLRIGYVLSKKPVLLPLRDWPLAEFEPETAGGPPRILPRVVFKKDIPEPSFRWKMNVLSDVRPDAERFKKLSDPPADLLADLPANENSGAVYEDGLEKIIQRGAFYSRTHFNRIVNWYSHVGIVHFARKDGKLFARHSMFFNPRLPGPDDEQTGSFDQPFMLYEAPLSRKPATEKPGFPLEPTS